MMKIIVAQLNFTVGNLTGNTSQMLLAIAKAKQQGADLIIFPELAICGYPPEDLLLREDFLKQCQQAVETLTGQAQGIAVIVGCPWRSEKSLHNAALVLIDQKIAHCYYKQKLPNYGVFDEARYFVAGIEPLVFRLQTQGPAIGLLICEDTWFDLPAIQAKASGAEVLISIHASPFAADKESLRQEVYKRCCQLNQLPMLCCQSIGAQDELVFDGAAKAFDSNGTVTFAASDFTESLALVTYDRQQSCFLGQVAKELSREAKIYQALVLAIKDYVDKNHFKQIFIGLSGGIDSSLTLALAVDALGIDRVQAISMPSRFTSELSYQALKQQLQLLPVKHHELNIESVFESTLTLLKANPPWDKTEENIQARIRGLLLMAFANKHHGMVLNTSNKSELAVGYSTLYGDMVGGFAALKDIPKTWVFQLAHYRNNLQAVIPEMIINRPPSAELALNQKDQDSLPPYEVLDAIIERFVEWQQSIEQIIAAGFDSKQVLQITRLILQNEYKRRQGPPGAKITSRAFTRERRYPITCGWKL